MSTSEIPTFSLRISTYSSYAAVAQKELCPKRDQGLIMDCVEGLNQTDYTCAVGEIVQPINVVSSSRISNNRMLLYLSSKDLVTNITDHHEFLIIGEHKVNIRPLVSKNKRVIFSNAPSNIPNYVFEDILDQLSVKRVSPISVLKASIGKDGYSHVASFRRQVYIKPSDLEKIPQVFRICYEDIKYFIYASTDSLKCFLCKEEGHVAKNCTLDVEEMKNTDNILTQSSTQASPRNQNTVITQPLDTLGDNLPSSLENADNTNINTAQIPASSRSLLDPQNLVNKRTHSEISSTASQASIETHLHSKDSQEFKSPKPEQENKSKKKKVPRIQPKITIDELLSPIKDKLEESDMLLNYVQFKSLLENLHGAKNPIEIATQYTSDIQALVTLFKDELYPLLENRSMKHRFTRIVNKLSVPSTQTVDTDSTDGESNTQDEL